MAPINKIPAVQPVQLGVYTSLLEVEEEEEEESEWDGDELIYESFCGGLAVVPHYVLQSPSSSEDNAENTKDSEDVSGGLKGLEDGLDGFKCQSCRRKMTLISQIYAPLDSLEEPTYPVPSNSQTTQTAQDIKTLYKHRIIYVLQCLYHACPNGEVRVVRCLFMDRGEYIRHTQRRNQRNRNLQQKQQKEKDTNDKKVTNVDGKHGNDKNGVFAFGSTTGSTGGGGWSDLLDDISALSLSESHSQSHSLDLKEKSHSQTHQGVEDIDDEYPEEVTGEFKGIQVSDMPSLPRVWIQWTDEPQPEDGLGSDRNKSKGESHELRLLREYEKSTGKRITSSRNKDRNTNRNSDLDLTIDDGEGDGGEWSGEAYEKAKWTDKLFKKFHERVERDPRQCIRYQRYGDPLLFQTADSVSNRVLRRPVSKSHNIDNKNNDKGIDKDDEFKCRYCGSEMVFEMQLMPALLSAMPHLTPTLSTSTFASKMGEMRKLDYGTILIYSCINNCIDLETNLSMNGDEGGVSGFDRGVHWRYELALVQSEPDISIK